MLLSHSMLSFLSLDVHLPLDTCPRLELNGNGLKIKKTLFCCSH